MPDPVARRVRIDVDRSRGTDDMNVAVLQPDAEIERGPWPTGQALVLALAPLVVATALGVAAAADLPQIPATIGSLLLPAAVVLALVYPSVVALARAMAYAPTTILVVASVVPALAYAARLLVGGLAKDAAGQPIVTPEAIAQRALPPAILAIGAFVAIDLATAAGRRGVLIGTLGAIVATAIFAASFVVPFYALFGLL
jgi:hypothetical protein